MSYSTTMMIPPLYEAQKSIEEMVKRFGEVIKYDNAGRDPTKARNNRFLSKLADSLFRYNMMRNSVAAIRQERIKSTHTYFYIFILLLWVGVFGLGAVFVVDFWKKRKQYDNYQWVIAFLLIAIALVCLSMSTVYGVRLRAKSLKIIRNLYNPDPFHASTSVKTLIEMLQVKFPKSQTSGVVSVTSIFPGLVMTMIKDRSLILSETSNIGNDSCKAEIRKDSRKASYAVCDVHNGYLYPFTDSKPLSHIALKKDLQSYDLYSQLRILRDATTYIKGFVLKSSDSGGTDTSQPVMSKEAEEYLTKLIADLLLTKYYIVDNLDTYMGDESTKNIWTAPSQTECHKSCLNDISCSAASYDETNNSCTTTTNHEMIYGKAAEIKVKTLIKENNGELVVFAKTTKEGEVYDYGKKYEVPLQVLEAYGTCSNSCITKSTLEYTGKGEFTPGEPIDAKTAFITGSTTVAKVQPSSTYMDHLEPLSLSEIKQEKSKITFQSFTTTDGIHHNSKTAVLMNKPEAFNMIENLSNFREYYITGIINLILENDPTNGYLLTDSNMDSIIGQVARKLQVPIQQYDSQLRDVLNDIPDKLQAAFFAKTSMDENSKDLKFVSFDRFVDKMQELNKKEFLDGFVYSVEALRASSDGINKLNKQFNMATDLNNIKNGLTDLLLLTIIIVGTLITLILIFQILHNHRDQKKNGTLANDVYTRFSAHLTSILKVVLVIATVIIIHQMVYGTKSRRDAKFQYNSNVLEKNGSNIVNESSATLELLFDLITQNRFGTLSISGGSVPFATDELKAQIANAIKDERKEKEFQKALLTNKYASKDTIYVAEPTSIEINNRLNQALLIASSNPLKLASSPIPEIMYEKIREVSDSNKDTKVTVLSNEPKVLELYTSLVSIVNSYDKCNSLVNDNMTGYPFPVLDVSVYVVVIIICVIAIFVIFGQMDPFTHLQEIKRYTTIKSRLTRSLKVDSADIGCFDVGKKMDDQMMITLKMIAIVFILVIAIAFAQSVQSNSDIFASGLYGSDLFVNSECYGL